MIGRLPRQFLGKQSGCSAGILPPERLEGGQPRRRAEAVPAFCGQPVRRRRCLGRRGPILPGGIDVRNILAGPRHPIGRVQRPAAGIDEIEQRTPRAGIARLLQQAAYPRPQRIGQRRPGEPRQIGARAYLARGLDDRERAEELARQRQQPQLRLARIGAQPIAPFVGHGRNRAAAHRPARQHRAERIEDRLSHGRCAPTASGPRADRAGCPTRAPRPA